LLRCATDEFFFSCCNSVAALALANCNEHVAEANITAPAHTQRALHGAQGSRGKSGKIASFSCSGHSRACNRLFRFPCQTTARSFLRRSAPPCPFHGALRRRCWHGPRLALRRQKARHRQGVVDRKTPPGRLDPTPVLIPLGHHSGPHPLCSGIRGLRGLRGGPSSLPLGVAMGLMRLGSVSHLVSAVAEPIAPSGGLLLRRDARGRGGGAVFFSFF